MLLLLASWLDQSAQLTNRARRLPRSIGRERQATFTAAALVPGPGPGSGPASGPGVTRISESSTSGAELAAPTNWRSSGEGSSGDDDREFSLSASAILCKLQNSASAASSRAESAISRSPAFVSDGCMWQRSTTSCGMNPLSISAAARVSTVWPRRVMRLSSPRFLKSIAMRTMPPDHEW